MPALPYRSLPWAPRPWSIFFRALLARLRPLHNAARPPRGGRSRSVSPAPFPLSLLCPLPSPLALFRLSLVPRRLASPPTPDLPVPDPSNPSPRAVIPSAPVAPHPLAARRPPAPWRCAPGPQNRVNTAKIRPKLSLASPHPLRGGTNPLSAPRLFTGVARLFRPLVHDGQP